MLAYPDLIRALADRLDGTFDTNLLDEIEKAMQLAIDADDPAWACAAALTVSELLLDDGRLADALYWCNRALAWIDRIDAVDVLPFAVAIAVRVNLACRRPTVAARLFKSALNRIRAAGDAHAEFAIIAKYASLVRDHMGPERALFWSRRAARMATQDFGDKSERCLAFTQHAMILSELGQRRESMQCIARVAALYYEESVTNPTRFIASTAATSIYSSIGGPDFASFFRRDASSLSHDLDDRPVSQAAALTMRADALSHRGDFQGALSLLNQAVDFAQQAQVPVQQISTLTSRIHVLTQLGFLERALADCREGVRIANRSGSPTWQLTMLTRLAILYCAVGQTHKLYPCMAAANRIVGRVKDYELVVDYMKICLLPIEARHAPWELLLALRRLVDSVLSLVRIGHSPPGVGTLMNRWPVELFSVAITHIQTELLPTHPDAWKYAVYFIDARQCIAIREAQQQHSLRMQLKNEPPTRRWRATNDVDLWCFTDRPSANSSCQDYCVRSLSEQEISFDRVFYQVFDSPLFKPGSGWNRKQPLVGPMTLSECRELLPDCNTVLLVVTMHHDEVLFTPIRLNAIGDPEIVAPPKECCDRPDAADRIQAWESDCLDAERQHIDLLFGTHRDVAHSDLLRSHSWQSHFADLTTELDLERVARIIEPDLKRRRKLHVTLIPDRYTCRLPIHAALMSDGKRLYEHFATFRYAHSLSALRTLSVVERSRHVREMHDRVIRGVAFASPHVVTSSVSSRWLDGVAAEVDAIRTECGDSSWWIHGNVPGSVNEATVQHFLERHNVGNLLVAMGDGNMVDAIVDNDGVKDIRCRMGTFRLTDDFLTHIHLQMWPFDFRPVQFAFFHACVMGRLTGARGYEMDGFLASLMSARCRRVLSALWEISDEAAPHFTSCLMRSLKKHAFGVEQRGPNSFAAAVRQAIDDFRAIDNHKYDHEFFWAPYLLYGLG